MTDARDEVHTVDVGPVAHGGHCVARLDGPHGRVVFVRHALPGERVRVLITEDGGGAYCRGDAIEILTPSPDRVVPPCPYAGPQACGGCDWQHVTPAGQRELKAAVVAEQLRRLAGLEVVVEVEELSGGSLGWRNRVRYTADAAGRLGLHRHRSGALELIDRCPLGRPGVGDAAVLDQLWPAGSTVEVVAADGGEAVIVRPPAPVTAGRRRAPSPRAAAVAGSERLTFRVGDDEYSVAAGGFWQGHTAGASVYRDAVIDSLDPHSGDVAFDLYGGAGLFAVGLAQAVGPTGRVELVEGDRHAADDAGANLARFDWAAVRSAPVTADGIEALGAADLVVLDPPRAGAGREVMSAVLGTGARRIAYVACDPAAFARDVRTALDAGWRLEQLRAFDAFPMTHHVECIGVLVPA
jgi:tRNA/tmRNA/rRNA uracil-C5-methylase (TrmA/RlmC/RlmD family)